MINATLTKSTKASIILIMTISIIRASDAATATVIALGLTMYVILEIEAYMYGNGEIAVLYAVPCNGGHDLHGRLYPGMLEYYEEESKACIAGMLHAMANSICEDEVGEKDVEGNENA